MDDIKANLRVNPVTIHNWIVRESMAVHESERL